MRGRDCVGMDEADAAADGDGLRCVDLRWRVEARARPRASVRACILVYSRVRACACLLVRVCVSLLACARSLGPHLHWPWKPPGVNIGTDDPLAPQALFAACAVEHLREPAAVSAPRPKKRR